LREADFDAEALAALAPPESAAQRSMAPGAGARASVPPAAIQRPSRGTPDSDVRRAAAAYSRDRALDWGTPGAGQCPACLHRECFGRLPEQPHRWACWSASHGADGAGVGIASPAGCWHGDAAD